MSPYTPVTPPRRSSTPLGRPSAHPPAPPAATPPAGDPDDERQPLPRIRTGQVDPAVAKAVVLGLGLLLGASVLLALLPPVAAAWTMGGLLVPPAAWAVSRLARGKRLRLGGSRAGGPLGGSRPGRTFLPAGRRLGRAGNGRFRRLGGGIKRAATRRFPRASRAVERAARRTRAGAARVGRAASRAGARLPLPKRVRSALAAHAAGSGADGRPGGRRRPRGTSTRPRGKAAGRRRGPKGSTTATTSPKGSSGRGGKGSGRTRSSGSGTGGGTTSTPLLGSLARLIRQVIPLPTARDTDKKKDRPASPTPSDTSDTADTADDGLDDEPTDDTDSGMSRRERFWYGLQDRVRFWGKAAVERLLPPPPDLTPFETGIDSDSEDIPAPEEDWDIHPPASTYDWPEDPSLADYESPTEPAADVPETPVRRPDPPAGSPHASSHPTDQPKPTGTITARSTTVAVDIDQFQHNFTEMTTPALISQAYRKASDEAWARAEEMEKKALKLHAAARAASHLDAKKELLAQASNCEDDAKGYKTLATDWSNASLEQIA